MKFTIENLEFILLIVARVSAFVYTAPFFNTSNTPFRVKAGFSVLFSIIIGSVIPSEQLVYIGVIGFAGKVLMEVIAGFLLGFFSNIAMTIVGFAGRIIDMEIGLAMVTEFDPVTRVQSSITGNLYTYFLTLMLLATNFHHILIQGFVDTYQVVPVGGVNLSFNLYTIMLEFMTDYFLIAFRIVLPLYAVMLLVNVILGILAKVAPQMNMFVIGIQLKILAGLAILFLLISLLPAVSDFITNEMIKLFRMAVNALS